MSTQLRSEPVSKDQAVWLSNFYKTCHTDYIPEFQSDDSLLHYSANILDRKFSMGYETFRRTSGDAEMHFIKTDVVLSIMDGLHQIRDSIACYCNTYDYIDEYGPFSLLYTRFFKAQIAWPTEYHCIFDQDEYLRPFDDFSDLLVVVQRAQLWSIFMVAALHCLALWDGISPAEVCVSLPPINQGHLLLARRSHCRVLEEQAALMANPNQDWDLPSPPFSPVYQPASPIPGFYDYAASPSSLDEDSLPSPPSFADDEMSPDSWDNSDLDEEVRSAL